MGARLSINLGLALGLVLALLFGAWRLQLLVHNYGTGQWNAGYEKAVSEFRTKNLQADNQQLQSNLIVAQRQAAANQEGLTDYAHGLASLGAAVERLRHTPFGTSSGSRGTGALPTALPSATGLSEASGNADDGLVSVPRDELIAQAESCDTDRERWKLGQVWARSISE